MNATTLPVVLVLYRTPLFAEGVAAALAGFAAVRAVAADADWNATTRALQPDGIVTEAGVTHPHVSAPVVRVDLERQAAMTPGELRNALLTAMLRRELE